MVLCFQEGIVDGGKEKIAEDASSSSSLNSLQLVADL